MNSPHILVIPAPAQGHVIPMMELSQCLVNHGFKVTFVNTDFNHNRVTNSSGDDQSHIRRDCIDLVSIPDGLEPGQDRNDLGKLSEAARRVMPGKLEELIEKINNRGEGDKITCVIADQTIGWALEIAVKMKTKVVAFWPASAAVLALKFSIPKLIDEGIIDNDGTILKNQVIIQLAPNMPTMKPENFIWACIGNKTTQKILFQSILESNKAVQVADWLLCNSAYDLEPATFTFAPDILPIGPLLASRRLGNSAGHFWPQDLTCLEWLDQQPPNSVIYVAFGSFTIFNPTQFKELALALELSERPFLWVVRPDITDTTSDPYPEGYQERVASRGRMVGWAPQQKVLAHPSIACFLSHCGWNSTLEGLSNGVPFLCWTYFADQFTNESYICDVWKVGLKFERNETGIITKGEIKNKLEQLLGDKDFNERVLKLKELAIANVEEGGQSNKIFKNFIEWMKSQGMQVEEANKKMC
ncbi:UDP-glycosyltransferase 83A1-like [Malus sylvestris]|uniref:UDP-glycosyltransferase 83A1-like n=1 Tax=Malus sylvestris TaxID=3752 RepID=UPI0021ACF987|nr:UDP-glycosyltransferase 83A1-like [Malus sylvestris]